MKTKKKIMKNAITSIIGLNYTVVMNFLKDLPQASSHAIHR